MTNTLTLSVITLALASIVTSQSAGLDEIQRVPLAAKLSTLQTEYVRHGERFGAARGKPEHISMREVRRTLRDEAMAVRIEDGIPEEYAINITSECKRDFERYVHVLISNDSSDTPLWAGRMFDSTGFFEPGIYDGNLVFEGRYDECRRATETGNQLDQPRIQGMHCLAYWYQWVWVKRGQGICIPDTCTDEDAIALLLAVYWPFLEEDSVNIRVHCERGKPDLAQDPAAIISIIILSLFGLLVVIATVYHYFMVEIKSEEDASHDAAPTQRRGSEENMETYLSPQPKAESAFENPEYQQAGTASEGETNEGYVSEKGDEDMTSSKSNGLPLPNGRSQIEPVIEVQHKRPLDALSMPEQLLLAFSMYVTMPLLTTTKQARSAIGCLNGIRFLAMAWIILGHTYILGTLEMPPTLENEYTAFSKWSIFSYTKIETIDVYVDTFFILSAFLVTLSFLRKLERTEGKLGVGGWIMYYFGRYWRLTPTYFIVLMIYSNFMHYFGTGPFMKDYLYDVDGCEQAWWVNLLYINNLYTGNGWCFSWSWYLAVDWQLYCVAPFFIYFLWRKKWIGFVLNTAGFLVGIVSTAVLKHKVYTQPDDAEDPVDDFSDIYIVPWCRCSVYFMGIGLGYLFFKTKGNIKIPKVLVVVGWLVAVAMYLMVSYLPHTQPWTTAGSTAYYTLNRVMWGVWVCWLIVACAAGYGGFVNTFLSWSFFVPLSKLTYMGYLIHPILCFLYFYGSPLQQYYYDYFFVYLFMANLALVHIFSLVLAVSVSAPLMGSIAVFLPSMRGKTRR